jgi:hypothetical protein
MKLDDRAGERIAALVTKAEALLRTYRRPPDGFIGFEGWVDSDLFAEWRSQSLVVLTQLLGAEHGYATSYRENTETPSVPSSVKQGMGVLRAAAEDLSGGYLFNVRALIAAEVFDDFLEMAEHLLATGYKDPAASLIGAVLEDGLRRSAKASGVAFKPGDGLGALNTALMKAGVYSKLVHSKIDTCRVVRNAADHGKFDEYAEADVRSMLSGVRDVLGTLLG